MILFPLYIAAIWIPAFLHRRRALGFIIALAGPLPVMLSAWMIGELMPSAALMREPWWLGLYGSLAGGVLFGAMVLACAPRRSRPHECRTCLYDLRGNVTGVCPECGATLPAAQDEGAEIDEEGQSPVTPSAAASPAQADPQAA